MDDLKMRTVPFWVVKQSVVVISYRGVLMGQIGYPETSVRDCHHSLRNNPEERSSHLLRGGSLKSCVAWRWPRPVETCFLCNVSCWNCV